MWKLDLLYMGLFFMEHVREIRRLKRSLQSNTKMLRLKQFEVLEKLQMHIRFAKI